MSNLWRKFKRVIYYKALEQKKFKEKIVIVKGHSIMTMFTKLSMKMKLFYLFIDEKLYFSDIISLKTEIIN